MRFWVRAAASAAVLAMLPMAAQAASAVYRLQSAVTLPGPVPGWDYLTLDPSRPYLFLGRRAVGVTVYDHAAQRAVATIENSSGANNAALVPEANRGYTANGDGSTTIFELSSLKTLGRVKLGEEADAAFYEPATGQVAFTMGAQIVFVDARTGKPTGRATLASEELETVVADGQGFLYVTERDKNRVARVDARRHALSREWPVAGCEMPTGLSIDRAHRRLFVGCRGTHPVLAVVDADSGKVIATKTIGRGNDGVAYDPVRRLVVTSNGIDGNLVIFDQQDPNTYALSSAITTRPMARTMAYDQRAGAIFAVTAEGMVDPAKPVNSRVAPFYPNRYFDDTYTVLTYVPK